jgi:hypothetical protein
MAVRAFGQSHEMRGRYVSQAMHYQQPRELDGFGRLGSEPEKKSNPITAEELDYLNANQLAYMLDRGDE